MGKLIPKQYVRSKNQTHGVGKLVRVLLPPADKNNPITVGGVYITTGIDNGGDLLSLATTGGIVFPLAGSKAEVVEEYLDAVSTSSTKDTSDKPHYCAKYNNGKSTGVRYALASKLAAVHLVKGGMSRVDVAKQYSCAPATIKYWMDQEAAGQFNEPIAFARTCEVCR